MFAVSARTSPLSITLIDNKPCSIDIDSNFNRFACGTATNRPRNKVEERLPQLSLIGNDRRDLGSKLVVDLDLLLLGHSRRCRTRLAQRLLAVKTPVRKLLSVPPRSEKDRRVDSSSLEVESRSPAPSDKTAAACRSVLPDREGSR